MKATAIAPSNIAFTKYWGKKDEVSRLPENGSVSMCVSDLLTTTTVEFSEDFKKDEVSINGEVEAGEETRAIKHLDRIRALAKTKQFARVVSENNFPKGTGLSSSASGFAALTVAGAAAVGLKLSEKQLSVLARQGSGSACRSVPSGFVEWQDAENSESSFAKTIFPPDYWDILDVVAIVSEGRKDVSTTEGMKSVTSSPFVQARLARMKQKNLDVKKYIKNRDFTNLGKLAESEALELHSIMITQDPPLIYLLPNTILMIRLIQKWRSEGLECYFTINTGQDVHILIRKNDEQALINKLKSIKEVRDIITNHPANGTQLTSKHLF